MNIPLSLEETFDLAERVYLRSKGNRDLLQALASLDPTTFSNLHSGMEPLALCMELCRRAVERHRKVGARDLVCILERFTKTQDFSEQSP
jgi:hypothetical protein